jgi:hypothetical protein
VITQQDAQRAINAAQDDARRQHMEWMNRMARDACQEVDGYEATRAAQEANINCEVGYEHLNVAALEGLMPPFEHMDKPLHWIRVDPRLLPGTSNSDVNPIRSQPPIVARWQSSGLTCWEPLTGDDAGDGWLGPRVMAERGYVYVAPADAPGLLSDVECLLRDKNKSAGLITQLQARLHGYQEMIDRTAHANDVLFQSYTRRIQDLESENFALKQIPYGWDREQKFREASDHVMQAAANYISDLERRLAVTEEAQSDHVGPSNPINDRANEVIGDLLNRRIVEPTRKELRRALDVADKPETGRLPDGTHRAPNSGAFR